MSLTRIILFAVLTLGATAASASDLGRDDFGYGITLRVDGAAPTYRVAVPLHVYQHTVRSDLGDIRVMNGSGEIVPYALRHAAGVAQSRAAAKLLPLFPLRGTSTEPSASLKLRLQSGNASIDIERPAVGAAMTRINGYLLDARSVTEALSTLEINWASDAGDFSSRLQLEASDDLNTWRAVADGPIINLHYAGQQFQQRRLDTPRVSARFFRLSWTDAPPAIEITSVSVEPALAQQDVKRLTLSAPAKPVTAEPGTYLMDLGAHIPLDRVNLDLPQINTIATVSFEARNDATADWRQISRASLYRLQSTAGAELHNPAIAIPLTTARHWRVRVSHAGGGLGHGVPVFVAGWLPDEVLFVARGKPPFELLYGSSEAKPAAVAVLALGPSAPAGSATPPMREATLSTPFSVGGPERLAAAHPKLNLRLATLWTVLLAGVTLLGWMAWRLLRRLG